MIIPVAHSVLLSGTGATHRVHDCVSEEPIDCVQVVLPRDGVVEVDREYGLLSMYIVDDDGRQVFLGSMTVWAGRLPRGADNVCSIGTGQFVKPRTGRFRAVFEPFGRVQSQLHVNLFRLPTRSPLVNHHSVSLDNAPAGVTVTNAGATINVPNTVSGSDRLQRLSIGVLTISGATLTGATFPVSGSPAAMSLLDSQRCTLDGVSNAGLAALLEIVAPDTGTSNIVVSFSGGGQYGHLSAPSFNGVDQATPSGTPAKASGSGTTASATVTIGTDGAGSDAVLYNSSTNGLITPNRTQVSQGVGFVGTNYIGGSQYKLGAGSTSFDWTSDVSTNWASVAAAINAAGGGGVVGSNYYRHVAGHGGM